MLATTTSRPDVQESYSAATSASNLRVTAVRRTPADMVIAAGMSPHHLGTKILRLMSEWDRAAKPPEPRALQIEVLASSYPIEPSTDVVEVLQGDVDLLIVENKHAGLVLVRERGGRVRFELPLVLAQKELAAWYEHELGILLQGLKTLPTVRRELCDWLRANGVEAPVHAVTQTILWFLAPRCEVCHGVGQKVAKNTNRLTGRPCGECKGTGLRKLRHGGTARKVLAYIKYCLGAARNDIRDKFKHQRDSRRGGVERRELVVCVGQRWRARDGRLWDILPADNPGTNMKAALLARLATDRETKKLYFRSGYPCGEFRDGPTRFDLIELLGDAP